MDLTFKRYTKEYEEKWDTFISEKSINGTILQTQKFLNYHKEGRFEDFSIMVYYKNNIICVIPACLTKENGIKIFNSHPGSTFGGLVLDGKYYKGNIILEIVDKLENFLVEFGISKLVLKLTSTIFCKRDPALLEYILRYRGYKNFDELSTFIDLKTCNPEIFPNIVQSKRSAIRQNIKKGLVFKELLEEQEIDKFYNILTVTLQKYNARPVHDFEELLILKDKYLKGKVKFWGIMLDNTIIAGSMTFQFNNVLHTQYLAADTSYQKYQPMSVLYYYLIKYAYDHNYDKLSWGISTEDKGSILNETLLAFKESFGSNYSMNRTYYKILEH